MDFWNKIVNFFTNTIPTVAQEQWLIVELVLLGIAFILLIVMLIVIGSKKRQKKNTDIQIMSLVSKHSDKAKELEDKNKEYTVLNEKYTEALSNYKALEEISSEKEKTLTAECESKLEGVNKDLTSCKELLAEREMSLSALKQECQEKDTKIANMTIEKDNLSEKYEERGTKITSLELDIEASKSELEKTTVDFNLLKSAHSSLENKNIETETDLRELKTAYDKLLNKHADLEEEHKKVLAENDVLKNFEVENDVLLKTLRKFREDEQKSKDDAAGAIEALEGRLTQKIEATFQSLTAKVAAESVKKVVTKEKAEVALEDMKRAELSKLAKKLGIANFATWSNKELVKEIKKVLAQ